MGGSVRSGNLNKFMKLDWNFQQGGGLKNSLLRGSYGYFLGLHNSKKIKKNMKRYKLSNNSQNCFKKMYSLQ